MNWMRSQHTSILTQIFEGDTSFVSLRHGSTRTAQVLTLKDTQSWGQIETSCHLINPLEAGVCIFINNTWATQFKVLRRGCTRDHELLPLSARLFNLPQEIGQITIIPANTPNNMEAVEIVTDSAFSRSADQPVFIWGDFNTSTVTSSPYSAAVYRPRSLTVLSYWTWLALVTSWTPRLVLDCFEWGDVRDVFVKMSAICN